MEAGGDKTCTHHVLGAATGRAVLGAVVVAAVGRHGPPTAVEQLLETLDIVYGVAQDLNLRQALVGVGTRASFKGLKRVVHLVQPFPLSHGGGLASVDGHGLLLASLARPQKTAAGGAVEAGREDVWHMVVVLVPSATAVVLMTVDCRPGTAVRIAAGRRGAAVQSSALPLHLAGAVAVTAAGRGTRRRRDGFVSAGGEAGVEVGAVLVRSVVGGQHAPVGCGGRIRVVLATLHRRVVRHLVVVRRTGDVQHLTAASAPGVRPLAVRRRSLPVAATAQVRHHHPVRRWSVSRSNSRKLHTTCCDKHQRPQLPGKVRQLPRRREFNRSIRRHQRRQSKFRSVTEHDTDMSANSQTSRT